VKWNDSYQQWLGAMLCSVRSHCSGQLHVMVKSRGRQTLWLAVRWCVFIVVSSQRPRDTTVPRCSGSVCWMLRLTWRTWPCVTCHVTSLFHALLPLAPLSGAGLIVQHLVSLFGSQLPPVLWGIRCNKIFYMCWKSDSLIYDMKRWQNLP